MKLSNFFSKLYLTERLSGGVVSLYTNRTIQQIAGGLLGIFLPIFLLERYRSISLVLVFYGVGFLFYLLLAALGAIIASKIDFRRALIASVLGGTFFYISMYFFELNIWFFSALALLAVTVDRMFYWVPYHSALAKFTNKKTRGRTLALLSVIVALLGVGLPVLAGFIITYHGFNVLFLIVIFVYLSSAIPFLTMPAIDESYSFGYWQTWKLLFHPRERRMLIGYMADGAQDFIAAVIWPIFIWQIMNNDYRSLGILSSLIVLASVTLTLVMGRYTDKFDKKKLLHYGTILYSLGWVSKFFIQTGFHIFVTSTYHNFTTIAMRSPFDALAYEKAADSGHYVDEYSVLREMAVQLGRILAIIILLILLNFLDLKFAFALAAVIALFINFI